MKCRKCGYNERFGKSKNCSYCGELFGRRVSVTAFLKSMGFHTVVRSPRCSISPEFWECTKMSRSIIGYNDFYRIRFEYDLMMFSMDDKGSCYFCRAEDFDRLG